MLRVRIWILNTDRNIIKIKVVYSVANPDPGSGAFLTPGSGIRDEFFLDPEP